VTRKRLLLIAFHFPPIQGSSGVQRSLAFSRYLPEFGWDVTVLTVHARAHERTLDENLKLIPPGVEAVRAPAWDAARHFAIAGRYPSWIARPDRWSSWVPFGTRTGLKLLGSRHFDAILSTFPIGSAHLIGRNLHRRTRLPWVADFRDPMANAAYPLERHLRSLWSSIQASVVREASRVTVTTPGAADFFRQSFPDVPGERIAVIENGFDPQMFGSDATRPASGAVTGPLELLHSGGLYIEDRHPAPFFRALRALIDRGALKPDEIRVRLRASGFEPEYRAILAELGLLEVVSLVPSVPYREALAEMRSASALLLFQGAAFNAQIPAKAYEYLYAGKPILGLTERAGDTGRLLERFGIPGIAPQEDSAALADMLGRMLPLIRAGRYPVPDAAAVMAVSRRTGAGQLAELLDRAVAEPITRSS
jgi:glycosyltransferase involved in cell wall biosynthesis